MKKLAVKLFNLISRLNLGTLYPVIVPSFVTAIFLLIFVAGIFCFHLRKKDKTSLLAVALSLYALSTIKTVCDLISKPIKENFVLSCVGGILMAAISFLFYALLCLQHNSRFYQKMRDKRLIDRLLKVNDNLDDSVPEEPTIIKNAFYDTPVKRVEFLPTEKFKDEKNTEFGVNYGEILGYISLLRRHELSPEEEKEITELENFVRNYSSKTLTCDERHAFSAQLMRLVKLISKYKAS